MENIQSKKTWHNRYTEQQRWTDKLADPITLFVGSWNFVILHIVWFGIWIVVPVESFPFGLLTMIVSLESILLSTFIMMSQNRQSDRDRIQAQADYETNIIAKQEIEKVMISLDKIDVEKLDKIINLLEKK